MNKFNLLRKQYPVNQKVSVKNTMDYLAHIYNSSNNQNKHPFFKYQVKLMKHILLYVLKIGKTNNIRFVSDSISIYHLQILAYFQAKGYKVNKIVDSMQWLALNLRY